MPNEIHNLQKPKRIRSVERTVEIIEYLAQNGASTLTELRRETGLPNATILRCLATLNDKGWIRRYLAEGRYELSSKINSKLNGEMHGNSISEIAAPHLQQLLETTGLPSDIAVRGKSGTITIAETTRTKGPLAPGKTVYGMSPSLMFSALGLAFISNCALDELNKHLLALKLIGTPEERGYIYTEKSKNVIKEVKLKGFAVRENGYWFEPVKRNPNLSAIAVPIGQGKTLIGAISLVWLSKSFKLEHIVRKYLECLQETSLRILQDVSESQRNKH